MNKKLLLLQLLVASACAETILNASAPSNNVKVATKVLSDFGDDQNFGTINNGWTQCLNMAPSSPNLINKTQNHVFMAVNSGGGQFIKPIPSGGSFPLNSAFTYIVGGNETGWGAAFKVHFDFQSGTWHSTKCFIRKWRIDGDMNMGTPLAIQLSSQNPNLGVWGWKSKLDPIVDSNAIYTNVNCTASIVITGSK